MSHQKYQKNIFIAGIALALTAFMFSGCSSQKKSTGNNNEDAAEQTYVPHGKHDTFYSFLSGGWSGNVSVYGIPSGRHLYTIPVFSEAPMNGYGYTEETKALLNTSYGSIPWGDTHHPEFSKTNGIDDGRWLFINDNNTPRIARISLKTFRTAEILEIPNTGGNHASAFASSNTEYLMAASRFSIPLAKPLGNGVDVPISSYKKNFKGVVSFINVDPKSGHMKLAFQVIVPPFDYDLGRFGLGVSKDWAFFSDYNSEEAHTLLEVNASQKAKDLVLLINWKKAAEAAKEGKGIIDNAAIYDHNLVDSRTGVAGTEVLHRVRVLSPSDLKGALYFVPVPKSPHGMNVSPTGEYPTEAGKLGPENTAQSFSMIQKALANNDTSGSFNGIPVLKYNDVTAHEVKNVGLGPLHNEFDGKGYGYSTAFISSEVIKYDLKTGNVVDRHPTYYAPGHLSIPGGDSRKPWGKYLLVLNKITKDLFLPTGPELYAGEQLFDISGSKMKLLSDFPAEGEPHYGQEIPASVIDTGQVKYFKLADNHNPYVTRTEKDAKVVRNGHRVDVYMTSIRSHFTPDNIEGIKVGDTVYFHVTNLEQEWDIPHGFAIMGARNSGMLIYPGETRSIVWKPQKPGVYPFYCTDFCSALHQEMQGYVRVSSANSNVKLAFGTNEDL